MAVGTVPENRRPSSGQAWLLLILFVPLLGLPLFWLIGSPYVHGRRHRLQAEANRAIERYTAEHPLLPAAFDGSPAAATVVNLNRRLTGLPCVHGNDRGLHADYAESIAAVTAAVHAARRSVHLEMYVLALDETTGPLFDALAGAVRRGVVVRVLYDHLGSRKYPGYRAMNRRLSADGIAWHRMMPIDLLHRRWRRPDLRNHRKLVVVDGERGFMGSQNMIDSSYLAPRNRRIGRHWVDLTIELEGDIVESLDVVFATDWYAETGEDLSEGSGEAASVEPLELRERVPAGAAVDGAQRLAVGAGRSTRSDDSLARADAHADLGTPFQLVPSGPGFPTEPNLRLFTSLIHLAERRVAIVSPYFVPDESLLAAITTAAYRGVEVELFVSEKADQFMVHHAQRSFYQGLLDAGVRIHLYPAPAVLHTKLVAVDREIGLIGSSNMDMRSFALDYEIMLLCLDRGVTQQFEDILDDYRGRSRELDPIAWAARPRLQRYLDNALRLTAAVQ